MSPAGICRAAASRPAKPFGEALRRELAEEGRIELLGEPLLHGVFLNSHVSRRDHVAVYVVRHFSQDRLPEANREIVACGFFRPAALPDGDHRGHPAADIGSARRQGADGDLALDALRASVNLATSLRRTVRPDKAMPYLKAVGGFLCFLVLASNVWSMSRWSEARGVYDDICYLRQAHLFQNSAFAAWTPTSRAMTTAISRRN